MNFWNLFSNFKLTVQTCAFQYITH